jgi:hypothetical protein
MGANVFGADSGPWVSSPIQTPAPGRIGMTDVRLPWVTQLLEGSSWWAVGTGGFLFVLCAEAEAFGGGSEAGFAEDFG